VALSPVAVATATSSSSLLSVARGGGEALCCLDSVVMQVGSG
jgi:hypothetical protein